MFFEHVGFTDLES